MNERQSTADAAKASDIDLVRACIAQLEGQLEAQKYADVRRKDNVPLQNRLVRLIGNQPLFNCKLDDVDTQVLWDTGSMLSLLDLVWLKERFPEAEVLLISDFLEHGEEVKV